MEYVLELREQKANIKLFRTPLLMIHGAAGGAWYFQYYMNYLSAHGFDCYALSLRGHGNSEGIEDIDTFTLDDYVEDVYQAVQLMDRKPVLLGHSMGGAVVQKYLGKYQDTIQSVVLLAPATAGGFDETSPLGMFFMDAKQFLRTMRALHPDEKITLEQLINDKIFSNRFDADDLREIKSKLQRESVAVRKDLTQPFLSEKFKREVDVLVIGSKDDHVLLSDQILKTAQFFDVEPVWLDNLCHFMTIDPSWTKGADEVLKFLPRF